MPLNSIVVIVLRLFALNWLMHDTALFASAMATSLPNGRPFNPLLSLYGPASLLLIFAISLWMLAPCIARIVSGGADATVNTGSLSRADLYSFGFVFLGLYFTLSSIADAINWIHYFTTVSAKTENFYKLTKPIVTLAAGLISLIGAPRWTKKVVAYEGKHHQA